MVITYPIHCGKSVRIRSFFGQYFPAFGLNTEKYSVSLRIQSVCGKIRTRKISNTDTFHVVIASALYVEETGNIYRKATNSRVYILSVLTTNSVLVIRRASLSWNLSLSCSVPLISPFRMKIICYCLEMVCYSDIKWLIMWRHSDWICTLAQFNSSRFRREKFVWIFSWPSLGKKENKERVLHRNIVT